MLLQVYLSNTHRVLFERLKPFWDMDIVKCIEIVCFAWLRHVVRMDESASARRVFDGKVDG